MNITTLDMPARISQPNNDRTSELNKLSATISRVSNELCAQLDKFSTTLCDVSEAVDVHKMQLDVFSVMLENLKIEQRNETARLNNIVETQQNEIARLSRMFSALAGGNELQQQNHIEIENI
jgi:hypothetical protein